jgi:hypothetical protein
MLVILCENSHCNDITISTCLALIYHNNANSSNRAGLISDVVSKIKFVCKGIFLVRKSDYELHDKLSHACHNGSVSAEVCVLPQNAVVFLVETNNYLGRCWQVI